MHYNGKTTLIKQARNQAALFAVVMALMPSLASATEYDLTPSGSQSLNVTGDFGGTAIVADYWSQPTGTGVFNPFLTLDAKGQTSTGNNNIESAYNSDGHNALYLDGHRPQWNTSLRVGDLATISLNNVNYFGFILDANEPGSGKSLISIDNIRIYTSATDNTASVQNNLANLNNLGTLRWALNNPTVTSYTTVTTGSGKNTTTTSVPVFDIDNWIKLDSAQENIGRGSNGGSGMSDMIVYIPQAAFGNAGANDFVWFYNLNGVHYTADSGLAAQAGFEEWSAVVRSTPPPPPPPSVPDRGATALLIGFGVICLSLAARRFGSAKA